MANVVFHPRIVLKNIQLGFGMEGTLKSDQTAENSA